jgi:phosphoribosylformylglycinamidine synthase II
LVKVKNERGNLIMMTTTLVLVSKINSHADVYWVKSKVEINKRFLKELSHDPDVQLLINPKNEWRDILNINKGNINLIYFHPGVTDNSAHAFKEILSLYQGSDSEIIVHSGQVYFNHHDFHFNELIQIHKEITLENLFEMGLPAPIDVSLKKEVIVNEFDLKLLSVDQLLEISKNQKWALNGEECDAIKNHFQESKNSNERIKRGLNPNKATDVEMEVIAQSWSEHCKHKIFSAEIDYSDPEHTNLKVNSIYKTFIKAPTFKLNRPWAVSVFKDNAGVVDWDKDHYLAIKVETHNSPSALDPYGGALTGILGVNRDILGTGLGFEPIANTNVFCTGYYDEKNEIPKKILHPKKILKGIHKGVQDGGNKSGIPTVNGAMCFDENFTGKPLVYCGTIGIAPKNSTQFDNKEKYHQKGDLILMCGGAVGLDGIHGATMSSIVLDDSVPKTMVQIGDPFTQKKLGDFVLSCRDKSLIKGITDNGAGGLSSSIGEMAEKTNGAKLELSKVKLKYSGLMPWEIIVSESQERMSLGIDPLNLEKVLNEAKLFGVDISVIGEFTDSGFFEIYYHEKCVALLDLAFLHDGNPQMKLKASWSGPKDIKPTWYKSYQNVGTFSLESKSLEEVVSILMMDKNIASKEYFIKQYDHEVKASTIVKPFNGIEDRISPNDSGVIWLAPHGASKNKACAIASGISYQYSHIDPKLMAYMAFDEAMRGVVAVGANPSYVAMTDNYCWPDPLDSKSNPDHEYKLGQLVRASIGLSEMSLSYEVPLISGKDSMKNDFIDENVKISVPPTLLMTAISLVDNVQNIKQSNIKKSAQHVYLLGLNLDNKNYFGHFLAKYFPNDVHSNPEFSWDLKKSKELYLKIFSHLHLIDSLHDVSEGGVLITLIEALFQSRLGLKLVDGWSLNQLFSEYPSQFVISVEEQNREQFELEFSGEWKYFGITDNTFKLTFNNQLPEFKKSEIDLSKSLMAWSPTWN